MAFPIAGIGASAGGLEAVIELLANLPATTGPAFVLVQHLSPDHPSALTEILAKKTPLMVAEAHEGLAVQPDHFYVIPPGVILLLQEGVFHLEHRQIPVTQSPNVIDRFLQSLAAECDNPIAIILSGTSSDGVQGARAIRAAGGIVFVQDPASARFGEMPKQVIATGSADFVLPPAEIARQLADLVQNFSFYPKTGVIATGKSAPAARLTPAEEAELWKRIFQALQAASGIDFSHYKRATLRRRLERRMAVQRVTGLAAYAQRLQDNPAEAQALAESFLIRVTHFFREPEAFATLARAVFPHLLENRQDSEPVRIWVPGCASGEEVYSLAIALLEFLNNRAIRPPIQIFGTDVSERAIEQARTGDFPESIAAEVSAERLQRFFIKQGNRYRIGKPIRDLCIFARQNILADPPFSRLDLLSCRNLLIYFDPILQRQALTLFHYALRPGGFLLLGSADTVNQTLEGFEVVDQGQHLYRRKPGTSLPVSPKLADAPFPLCRTANPLPSTPAPIEHMRKEADRILLEHYVPDSIVVDQALNVLQFRGCTASYLEHRSGTASLSLRDLVPPALGVALTAAMETARWNKKPVQRQAPLERAGQVRSVDFEVVPLLAGESESLCYLILFHKVRKPEHPAGKSAGFWTAWWHQLRAFGQETAADEREARIRTLERELEASRYALRTMQDEHEASKEELSAAQEELISANEELQSTNEELESAKEELQAANEELSTINDELSHRNRQLNDANETLQKARSYADSIIDTVHEGLLVLDGELRVRRANRTFYDLFRTCSEDTQDRFLFNLGDGHWAIPQLQALLQTLRDERTVVQDYEVTHDFPGLGIRTLRLNARRLIGVASDQPNLLLAIEDITERKQMEANLRESEERFRLLVEGVQDYALFMLDPDGRIVSWNAGAERIKGWSTEEVIGRHFSLLYPPEARDSGQPQWELDRAAIQGRYCEEGRRVRKDGSVFWAEVTLTALRDAEGRLRGFAKLTRDITAQKEAEQQLKDNRARLASIVESARDAIITVDAEQRIVLFNPAAAQIFRCPAAEALGSPLGRFIPERFRAAHSEHVRRFGESGITNRAMGQYAVLSGLRADGEEFPVEASISQNEVGGQKLFTVILRDITERQRAEQALREADQRKNEFLAMLGHELRNPLAAIRNAVKVMQKVNPAHAKHQWAEQVIDRQASHLARLVDDLLDVSRILQGKISLHKAPLDLANVLHQAIEASHPFIKTRQHKLLVSLPDEPLRLFGDGVRLVQVVSNLLDNAAKYTPEGGTIWLDAMREQDEAIIRVRDTGEGISEALLPYLFESFTQGARTLDRARGGLGLGLTIVQRIVTLHSGRVEARSAGSGQGSEFVVRLPLA